ncbi:MAG: tRNA uridine-5-carboxymethylaminomethyl(34) synthesis GTPase MnmE [Nitrospiraceae bacterium]|nr:tRNA uridine-5-carboxymethylaminomethyl(34) synthesis GTPase MnmE [Nitrospiraceae bacterium]
MVVPQPASEKVVMYGGLEDTICAIATPAGEGGIGIVRLSGPQALVVASQVVRLRSGDSLSSVPSHTLHIADLVIPTSDKRKGARVLHDLPPVSGLLDEALVVYMKAPRSFTAEDVVEIQSHGGSLVLGMVCKVCMASGARMAEPGEFTKRAFLNGRLDLSQAEAVLDTIRATSSAGLNIAQRQLRGDLAHEVEQARTSLLTVLAHVEAGIDFVDEDISFLQRDELMRIVREACAVVQKLEATAQEGRILREGARVVILGRPNVGKSSLLNRLLKEERAIVTAIPGTTRDVIEESINLDGVLIHLVDTAGVRETDDLVEQEGIKRTRAEQNEADLLLVVVDGSAPLTSDDWDLLSAVKDRKHVVLLNKADLADTDTMVTTAGLAGHVVYIISAKTGLGVETVKSALRDQLVSRGFEAAESVTVTNVRHRDALRRAGESLGQALESVQCGMAGELVSIDVRAAADALGEITGAITTDEILDRIFSEFCIGK